MTFYNGMENANRGTTSPCFLWVEQAQAFWSASLSEGAKRQSKLLAPRDARFLALALPTALALSFLLTPLAAWAQGRGGAMDAGRGLPSPDAYSSPYIIRSDPSAQLPAVGDDASSFDKLMALCSTPYSMKGKWQARPSLTNPGEALSDIAADPDPVLSSGAQRLQALSSTRGQRGQQLNQVNRRLGEEAMDVGRQALNGDFAHRETRTTPVYGPDGDVVGGRSQDVEVDNGLGAATGAAAGGALLGIGMGQMAQMQSAIEDGQAHLAIWNAVTPRVSTWYPRAREQRSLVRLDCNAPDSTRGLPGTFTATNTSGSPLSRVLLRFDLTHLQDSPNPTAREVFFVPRWEAGQTLYLPVGLNKNLLNDGLANPAIEPGDMSLGTPGAWFGGVGGVGKIDWEVWSDTARQAFVETSFPANAVGYAQSWYAGEVGRIERAMRQVQQRAELKQGISPRSVRGELPASRQFVPMAVAVEAAAPTALDFVRTPEENLAFEIAHVSEAVDKITRYAPADSPVAERARALLRDPQGAVIARNRERVAALYEVMAKSTLEEIAPSQVALPQFTAGRPTIQIRLTPGDANGNGITAAVSVVGSTEAPCTFEGQLEYSGTSDVLRISMGPSGDQPPAPKRGFGFPSNPEPENGGQRPYSRTDGFGVRGFGGHGGRGGMSGGFGTGVGGSTGGFEMGQGGAQGYSAPHPEEWRSLTVGQNPSGFYFSGGSNSITHCRLVDTVAP